MKASSLMEVTECKIVKLVNALQLLKHPTLTEVTEPGMVKLFNEVQ